MCFCFKKSFILHYLTSNDIDCDLLDKSYFKLYFYNSAILIFKDKREHINLKQKTCNQKMLLKIILVERENSLAKILTTSELLLKLYL